MTRSNFKMTIEDEFQFYSTLKSQNLRKAFEATCLRNEIQHVIETDPAFSFANFKPFQNYCNLESVTVERDAESLRDTYDVICSHGMVETLRHEPKSDALMTLVLGTSHLGHSGCSASYFIHCLHLFETKEGYFDQWVRQAFAARNAQRDENNLSKDKSSQTQ